MLHTSKHRYRSKRLWPYCHSSRRLRATELTGRRPEPAHFQAGSGLPPLVRPQQRKRIRFCEPQQRKRSPSLRCRRAASKRTRRCVLDSVWDAPQPKTTSDAPATAPSTTRDAHGSTRDASHPHAPRAPRLLHRERPRAPTPARRVDARRPTGPSTRTANKCTRGASAGCSSRVY